MATWPGKDSTTVEVEEELWEVKVFSNMPGPCGRYMHAKSRHQNPEQAGRRARSVLNSNVRKHIRQCQHCQANKVYMP
jgi:hypothetical protein